MATKKPNDDRITIGFMTSSDLGKRLSSAHGTTPADGVQKSTAPKKVVPQRGAAPQIVDAVELPSDEALAAAWEQVPESVREAFGYAKVDQAKRTPRV
ncbi:hypothetical protein PFX98_20505 [Paucibacter sediminis]|uniref:Uncharacterized protein n=1 Tax=Paucibacter sediminis TaxID=3019553 RepID=A0AA95SV93_9BURK|nr:hypothetical protein [Paucibacter sp. S2-9]WIT11254.1 hypothetical protein PFX98_20505 [Paucibacter sp. S2-9]